MDKVMEIYSIKPRCNRCSGNKVTKVKLGSSYYKKCIDCSKISPILESDELTLIGNA